MLLLLFPAVAFAYEEPAEEPTDTGIAITVVVPRPEINRPIPQPEVHHIYPVHVWESRENGRRELIRVYELRDNEDPAHISRASFEREGFIFELGEIVRREIPQHSTFEHAETITVSTQTNDLATVLQLLAPTLEHMTEDGYFGILNLDISSIQIESQGTRSSSHTATRTREFPHLSSRDTSLVPRSITEKGVTYNLADVDWHVQSTTTVDYRELPSTFTAIATYTRTATRTSTIGYTTTAVYSGQLSRISVGRTEFTVNFIGIPIITPVTASYEESDKELDEKSTTPLSSPAPAADYTPTVLSVEQVHIGGIIIETEVSPLVPEPIYDDYLIEDIVEGPSSMDFRISNVFIFMLFVSGITLAYLAGKKGRALFAPIKKLFCFALCLGLTFVAYQTVYATTVPDFMFGNQGAAQEIHFNPSLIRPDTHHDTSGIQPGSEAVHFHPRTTNPLAPVRASPTAHHMQNIPATYIYGDFLGTLTVERLGRSVKVIGGATMSAMDVGAGHFSFTGLNHGNTGLIGHNRGRVNGFFSFVRELREGDILILDAGGIVRRYAVSSVFIVDETDFTPLMPYSDNRLTLVTCVEYRRNQRRVAVALEI